MKAFSKNLLTAVAILLLVTGAFALFGKPFETPKVVSLTQLSQDINEERVEKVVVSGNKLEISYKDKGIAVSQKETETGLSETLLNYGVQQEKIGRVAIEQKDENGVLSWILPFAVTVLPLLLFVFFFLTMFRQARAGVGQAFDFTKSKARLFGAEGHQVKERVTFKDVAGLKEAKEELNEVVDFLKNPEKYLKIGARIPRGVLLVGAPGTGKTLLARAVASEAGVPFFSASGSEFIEMFVGVGSSRVRDLFQTAKKAGKAIIFIDELDAIGRTRGVGWGGGHDEREQTLNQILVEMDGFDRDSATIVMAASVTGDTPVLIRKDGEYKLLPIADVVDPYYQEGEEDAEKNTGNLEALGFEQKEVPQNLKGRTYFQRSALKKVRGVFRHRVKEIYEIEYLGGKVRTTGNHSVFVRTAQGILAKPVSMLRSGEILVDLPYKVNRTSKALREVRGHLFEANFSGELSVWEPLFEPFAQVQTDHQYVLAHQDGLSQSQLGRRIGFSQTAIGKWERGVSMPRPLSRKYFQHNETLPERVPITPELARLFGYYTAEGYARKEVDFCFNKNESAYIEDVKSLMRSIFHIEPQAERRRKNAVNLTYQCKPLASFFIFHCGKGAKNKHVPQFLFEAPRRYFIEFLRGYAAGDGHINKRGKLELTSVNKQLLMELNWLTRMHGFKGYVTSFTAKEGRTIGDGKPLQATKAYRLGFGKTQNPFDPKPGKQSIKRPVIRSIKRFPYDGYVYDFCGCENEAFFGGESPILLHNTNRPDVLDSALLRPGRFDRRIILDLPDVNDREAILEIHAKGKPLASQAKLREVAERTPGFSGADLANLINEAAIFAARKNKTQVSQQDLLESIEKVMLGPERKSHILSKKEKEITAYHEAGHALVAASLKHTDPVRKVSIIARGRAGGYTLKLPSEDRHLKSRTEFIEEIAVALGGYAAEKLVFKDVTTGASNDLQIASEIARALVKEYGMSEKLGPVTFGESAPFGPFMPEGGTPLYSETVAAQIDQEVSKLIDQANKTAGRVLRQRRTILAKLARILIEKETIEREEFDKIIGKKRGA